MIWTKLTLFPSSKVSKKQKGNTSLAPTATPLTWIQRLQILLDAARGDRYWIPFN